MFTIYILIFDKKVLKNVNEKTYFCCDILLICKELRKNFHKYLQKKAKNKKCL